ncbi:thioredoxin family protein [Bifidobacterium cuniculi]|uniref:Thioredoxin n=1 Tax=Bifidobacterium cuniculi TaxID=1688 RepID=A0A087ARP3_9BIFI|nr:thioredoxin family protein [Bifidobacterium cuniculi]KFI61443.1 thioredoxin [Bifidobacterium cuniculi]
MAVQDITSDTFEQAVKDHDLSFFDFNATWCGPCRAFGPIFEKASEQADNQDIFFGSIDIDKNQDLANQANIQAVPTLMIVKEGHIVYQEAGALRAADLDDLIAQAKKLDVKAALAEAAANGNEDPSDLIDEQ